MKIWKLSIKNILSRPGTSLMNLIILSVGIAIISIILQVRNWSEEYFYSNIEDIDIVVGAKGSPLQLVLSAVYHIDDPTGNISLAEAQSLLKNPLVESGIPLSYGDNYKGFRIVGTTPKLPEHYGATLQEGKMWNDELEVVIGRKVADQSSLSVGDELVSAHGLVEGGSSHDEHSFRVVGIFNATGTVFDNLILTSTESVWHVHHHEKEVVTTDEADTDHKDNHKHEEHHKHELAVDDVDREITALLIKFRNPMAMVTLPRLVNQQTSMQAALPVYEIEKLFSVFGIGLDVIQGIAIAMLIIAGLSIFVSLYNLLKERMFEFALLRTYGGTRWQVMELVLLEGLIMSFAGYLFGVVLARVFVYVLPTLLEYPGVLPETNINLLTEEYLLLVAALVIGVIASLIPATKALRMNISKILTNE